jgi:predicted RNase H-like nuclease (RuvC/YqgF family)
MFRSGQAEGEPAVASVSRMQLLTTNLVERVHDAVYVLPRHASQNLNLDEYAIDIAYSLQELVREAENLPRRTTTEQLQRTLQALQEEDTRLTVEISHKLKEAEQLLSQLNS